MDDQAIKAARYDYIKAWFVLVRHNTSDLGLACTEIALGGNAPDDMLGTFVSLDDFVDCCMKEVMK